MGSSQRPRMSLPPELGAIDDAWGEDEQTTLPRPEADILAYIAQHQEAFHSCFLVASSMICIFKCHQNRGYESIPQRVFLHHLNYQHGRVAGRLNFSRMSRHHIWT